jgi:uracil-DNA glycosylase
LTRHGGTPPSGPDASIRRAAHPVTGERFPSPVPPGTGWPDDPAGPDTEVADDAADVRRLATDADLHDLTARISVCRACPGLVGWREQVATQKRRAFADQPYWGRPIAGWGAADAGIVVLGLAPAAHGGNRTGRIFTGDRSGDWLFAALHRAGLAAQERSDHAGDGQRLLDTRMVATVRCAPPDNKPSITERDTCEPWLHRELALLSPTARCVVCLGSYAWAAGLRAYRALGYAVPRPQPRFGHGAEAVLTAPAGSAAADVHLLGCYHPSQQNTFTGKLTEAMLDAVLARARDLAHPRP